MLYIIKFLPGKKEWLSFEKHIAFLFCQLSRKKRQKKDTACLSFMRFG
jgi:hypothetical protein